MSEDLELLRQWQAGDQSAGNRLFERQFDMLARFFCNKVTVGVDDLIQRTFLDAMSALHNYRGDGSFRSYLLGVAHNVLRHHYRRRARKEQRIDFGTVSVADLAPGPSTMHAARRSERVLLEGLRKLPMDLQVVLELYFWEDMTAAEIAHALGLPEGTIRTRIRRARHLLERSLPEIAASPSNLQTTGSRLEDWARIIGDRIPEEFERDAGHGVERH